MLLQFLSFLIVAANNRRYFYDENALMWPTSQKPFLDCFRLADNRELSYGRSNQNVDYGHFSASASAFQRLANREQEDGTLTFRVRRKEVNHVIVEESQPSGTQAQCICR